MQQNFLAIFNIDMKFLKTSIYGIVLLSGYKIKIITLIINNVSFACCNKQSLYFFNILLRMSVSTFFWYKALNCEKSRSARTTSGDAAKAASSKPRRTFAKKS